MLKDRESPRVTGAWIRNWATELKSEPMAGDPHSQKMEWQVFEVMRVLFYSQIRATVTTTKNKSNKPTYFRGEKRYRPLGVAILQQYISRSSCFKTVTQELCSESIIQSAQSTGAVENLPPQILVSLEDKLVPIKKWGIMPRYKHKIKDLFLLIVVMLQNKNSKERELRTNTDFQFFINHFLQKILPKISN